MGISVAMVGTGAFAQGFIPLFQAHPLVERIALCDLDAEKLERNKARLTRWPAGGRETAGAGPPARRPCTTPPTPPARSCR